MSVETLTAQRFDASLMQIKSFKRYRMVPIPPHAGEVLIDGLTKLNRPYWISAGTLLGLYRDGDFMPYDTDLDVATIGFDGIERYLAERFAEWTPLRFGDYDGLPMQRAYVAGDTVFDLFIHWLEGDTLYNMSINGKTRMHRSICEETQLHQTPYGMLSFPEPPDEYLTIRYGDTWPMDLPDGKAIFHDV